jgi:hypothetical protein
VSDIGLRVPAQNLRDYSMFHVSSSCKNRPSAARNQIFQPIFIYNLLDDIISSPDCLSVGPWDDLGVTNFKRCVMGRSKPTWKCRCNICIECLSNKYGKIYRGLSVYRVRFETGTYWMQVRRTGVWANVVGMEVQIRRGTYTVLCSNKNVSCLLNVSRERQTTTECKYFTRSSILLSGKATLAPIE